MFVVASVRDVILVMIDIAMVFEGVAARLDRLVRPLMAFVTFYALLVVVFACLYRIADLTTRVPQFALHGEPARISFADSLYYSVATITTLGFGDIAPTLAPGAGDHRDRGRVGHPDAAVRLQRDHAQRRRRAAAAARLSLTMDRVSPRAAVMREPTGRMEHGLARSEGTGHRRGRFSRRQSLPHAGAAGRARGGAGRLPVRWRRQPGEPGRCAGGTGARRHPRDRPAQRVRGRLGDLQPGGADQPYGRPERPAGRHRGERGGAGAADPGGARGGAGCGRGARLHPAVLRPGAEAAGGREPAGRAARRQRRVEVRRRAVPGCWSTGCAAGRWCRCG